MTKTIDSEETLRLAVDYVPEGLAVFDPDLRLVTSNCRYRELLDLPAQLVGLGTPLYDIALFLARRGDLGPGDATSLAALRVQTLTQSRATVSQRRGAKGQALEFHSSRLPDGGLVVSFSDVTARVEAETELATINQSLEGRVEERTAALIRLNVELELARSKADAANRDKTRFLAAASHDLLQPLNAARLYTATLVERAGRHRARRAGQCDRGVADGGRGDHVGAARHLADRCRGAEAGAGAVRAARPASRRSTSSSRRRRRRKTSNCG